MLTKIAFSGYVLMYDVESIASAKYWPETKKLQVEWKNGADPDMWAGADAEIVNASIIEAHDRICKQTAFIAAKGTDHAGLRMESETEILRIDDVVQAFYSPKDEVAAGPGAPKSMMRREAQLRVIHAADRPETHHSGAHATKFYEYLTKFVLPQDKPPG